MRMNKNNGQASDGRGILNYAAEAMEQMELYCVTHPGSPSAVRRPRLSVRGELWIALLGPSVDEGIVGIGPTVAAALRAFDTQYLVGIRPPIAAAENAGAFQKPLKTFGATRRRRQNRKSDLKSSTEVSGFASPA